MSDAVIVDVDGTLVDVTGVRHYVLRPRNEKDFDSFHKGASLCPPIVDTVRAVNSLPRSMRVIVVTARKRRWEYLTRAWLNEWVRFDELHMRDDADSRVDVEVKRDILAEIRTRHNVVMAFDDNPAVIELWESEGIFTVKVPGWEGDTK